MNKLEQITPKTPEQIEIENEREANTVDMIKKGAKFVPAENSEGKQFVASGRQIDQANDEMYTEKAEAIMTKEQKIDSGLREKKIKANEHFGDGFFFESKEEFDREIEDDKFYKIDMITKGDLSNKPGGPFYEMQGPFYKNHWMVRDYISSESAKHHAVSGKELKEKRFSIWGKVKYRPYDEKRFSED
jgi:hypothetical protein